MQPLRTAAILVLIALTSLTTLPVPARAQTWVGIKPSRVQVYTGPSETATFNVTVYSNMNTTVTVDVSARWRSGRPGTLTVSPETVTLPPGGQATITVTVSIHPDTEPGYYGFTVEAVPRAAAIGGEGAGVVGGVSTAASVTVIGVGNSAVQAVEVGRNYLVVAFSAVNTLNETVEGTYVVELYNVDGLRVAAHRENLTLAPGGRAGGYARFEPGPGTYTVRGWFEWPGGRTGVREFNVTLGVVSVTVEVGAPRSIYDLLAWLAGGVPFRVVAANDGDLPVDAVLTLDYVGGTLVYRFQLRPGETRAEEFRVGAPLILLHPVTVMMKARLVGTYLSAADTSASQAAAEVKPLTIYLVIAAVVVTVLALYERRRRKKRAERGRRAKEVMDSRLPVSRRSQTRRP